jgi:hypothetical protein
MYKWYSQAALCYAYLSDLGPGRCPSESLPPSRLFKGGWILQELIAPREVVFYPNG